MLIFEITTTITIKIDNGSSLSISYMHLSKFAAVLAIWLVEQPLIMLELFDSVAMDVAKIAFQNMIQYIV